MTTCLRRRSARPSPATSYRRDGGENHDGPGRLSLAVKILFLIETLEKQA